MWFIDRLSNLLSGLGTGKDKSIASTFGLNLLLRPELEAMYRSDWLARKIVDIIPFDMTREWRDWQAEQDQIDRIEATETRLGVRNKVLTALQWARLYGGAALFMGTKDIHVAEEMRIDRVGKDGLLYLNVLAPHHLTLGPIERDPASPYFGEPRYYEINSASGQVRVHPSRIVRFTGAPVPDVFGATVAYQDRPVDTALISSLWGDSILQVVYDAVQNAASVQQNIASLLSELKLDVVSVPNLQDSLATQEGTARITARFATANLLKSQHNVLLLQGGGPDVAETWEQKQLRFSEFPELLRTYLQIAAGAADIPATRLLGQAPAGLNATGDSDIRNYYDRVAAQQNVDMAPRLTRLDDVLIYSALGSRPSTVYYEFAPLWQMTETERAEIAAKNATTMQTMANTGLTPTPVLAAISRNQMIESGSYPGAEAAFDEFDASGADPADFLIEEDDTEPTTAADAKPRTLYVHRKVTNAAEIVTWAKGQGFETTLSADDLHVTVAFSRAAVDWMKMGEPWEAKLEIGVGGPRIVERFDGGATVLLFASSELNWRWQRFRENGASWDHPEYQPHITISYQAGDLDLSKIEPYQGKIVLGPEIFEEVDLDWQAKE